MRKFKNGQRIRAVRDVPRNKDHPGRAPIYKGEVATVEDDNLDFFLIHVRFDNQDHYRGPAWTHEGLHLTDSGDWEVYAPVGCSKVPGSTHAVLEDIFAAAVQQSKDGKGLERHGTPGVAFEDQPIVTIGKDLGNTGFQLGQARKKITEASRLFGMGRKDAALAELLGAMNYTAAGYYLMKEQG